LNPTFAGKISLNSFFWFITETLSCGLLGPEIDGTTEAKSSSKDSPVYTGSFWFPVKKRP